jgi:hypothetical protein
LERERKQRSDRRVIAALTVPAVALALMAGRALAAEPQMPNFDLNRDTRDVRVYVLFGDAWRKVPFLETASITGDIFVSNKPGKYRPEGQELNALVVDLYEGNKECPTRRAGSASAQMYEARSCVVRWNGTKFTYKPL